MKNEVENNLLLFAKFVFSKNPNRFDKVLLLLMIFCEEYATISTFIVLFIQFHTITTYSNIDLCILTARALLLQILDKKHYLERSTPMLRVKKKSKIAKVKLNPVFL